MNTDKEFLCYCTPRITPQLTLRQPGIAKEKLGIALKSKKSRATIHLHWGYDRKVELNSVVIAGIGGSYESENIKE
jgi:hypothetical protein